MRDLGFSEVVRRPVGCLRWELLPELSAPRPACIGAPFCPALLVLPPRVGDSPSGLLCCKCCSRPSLRTLPVLWTSCLDRPLRLACPSLCRVGPRLFPGSVPSFKPIGLLCPLIRCCQHLLWRAFTAPRLVGRAAQSARFSAQDSGHVNCSESLMLDSLVF